MQLPSNMIVAMGTLFLPYLSLATIVILLFSVYLNKRSRTKPNQKTLPPPPGRRSGWPFIGETLDYLHHLKNGFLEKFVEYRKDKYSSEVFLTSLIGYPMAILCGAKGNKFLFTNENTLVQVWYPHSMERIFPKTHNIPINEDAKNCRKFLTMFLKASALQGFLGNIDMLMKQQIKSFAKDGTLKVREKTGRYTMTVSSYLFLGVNDSGKIEKLQRILKDIAGGIVTLAIDIPGTAFSRALKASQAIRDEIEEVSKKRRKDLFSKRMLPDGDLLSHMLLATDDDGEPFNGADIASHLVGFLHAGYDPIRAGLTFIVKYLAELPGVYHEVLQEQMEIAISKKSNDFLNWKDINKMRYSWNVACEVFRLIPPVLGTFREAITDFTYAGHTIKKGTKIHWNSHSTHKDSKYFSDPYKFDPSRFEGNGPLPYSFVPFGGGPRMCPGNEYTRVVTLVFMHNMVINFKWELLSPGERVVFDPHPRPTQGLPIRLIPHKQ